MNQCYTPCIYYCEIENKSKNPSMKIICDMRDGEEIRNIPADEIGICKHFKTYKDLKEK